jgi:hypothetical protein
MTVDGDMEGIALHTPGKGKEALDDKLTDWHEWKNCVEAVYQPVAPGIA